MTDTRSRWWQGVQYKQHCCDFSFRVSQKVCFLWGACLRSLTSNLMTPTLPSSVWQIIGQCFHPHPSFCLFVLLTVWLSLSHLSFSPSPSSSPLSLYLCHPTHLSHLPHLSLSSPPSLSLSSLSLSHLPPPFSLSSPPPLSVSPFLSLPCSLYLPILSSLSAPSEKWPFLLQHVCFFTPLFQLSMHKSHWRWIFVFWMQSAAGVPVRAAVDGSHGLAVLGLCRDTACDSDTAAVTGGAALPQRPPRHHQRHHSLPSPDDSK